MKIVITSASWINETFHIKVSYIKNIYSAFVVSKTDSSVFGMVEDVEETMLLSTGPLDLATTRTLPKNRVLPPCLDMILDRYPEDQVPT